MKNRSALLAALLALALLLAATVANAGTSNVTLAWDANTEPDLVGYKIYRASAAGGPYTLVATLGKVTTYTVTGLADGTHYFVATAYDAKQNESGYSNEVNTATDGTAPGIPKNVRVTVVVVVTVP